MTDKTAEEQEAAIWAVADRAREARRERVQAARAASTKEPYDYARLQQLYSAIAIPPHPTLPASQAENFEASYYLSWNSVLTLQEAAEHIRGLIERGVY